MAYNTPFVGLFLYAPCFIKLVACPELLKEELRPISCSRYTTAGGEEYKNHYPIGCLGDILEIHFLHYANWDEAREAWYRRLARLNWNNLFWVFTDRDGCSPNLIREFDSSLHNNKVCFSATNYPELKSVVWIKECAGLSSVIDLYSNFSLVNRNFDFVNWLNEKPGGAGQFYTFVQKSLDDNSGGIV